MSDILSSKDLDLLIPKNNRNLKIFEGYNEKNNTVADSATSAPDTADFTVMQKIIEVPQVVSDILYHVVLDCDYGEFIDNIKRQARGAVIFGKIGDFIKENLPEKIPVVHNKEDAEKIAKNLIAKIVNFGSAGSGNKKKYPFLGAVIMGFCFNTETINQRTHRKVDKYTDIKKEEANTEDFIYWQADTNKIRGLVSKQAMAHTTVINAEYIVRKDINAENGFALLNLVPELTADNIIALKCLYEGKKANCFTDGTRKTEEIDVVSRGEIQLGGKYESELMSLATREKAKYLAKKQMNGEKIVKKEMNGGNLNNVDIDHATEDEVYWKAQYTKTKSEYLKMKNKKKAQSGGKLNNIDMDHATEDEAYWKEQYTKTKSEYLKAKNKKKAQSGGNVDMNHATEDDAYWRDQYVKAKSIYVNKKNHSKK